MCPLCCNELPHQFAKMDAKTYWRCAVCRLTFLPPEHYLTPEAEFARYQTHENHPANLGYRNFLSRLTEHLVPRLTPGMEGLDYGAGPGPTLSVMLEEQGFPMAIYDPYFAPDTDALARRYDFITCTETVEHFHSPAEEFQRFDGLLRDGGWLGVMTEMLEVDAEFHGWWYHRDPTHVCFYRRETMDWIAGRFGWRVEYPRENVTLFHKVERCVDDI